MSNITINNLARISRNELASLLLQEQQKQTSSTTTTATSTPASSSSSSSSTTTQSTLAIIDVRDSDYIGGHIVSSTNIPSSTLDYRIPELIRTLRDKEVVVFHCALSQQRGPSAALRYLREKERLGDGKDGKKKQEVFVLDGGFVKWQEV
jgi:rhodanese-related sulfurtransferase